MRFFIGNLFIPLILLNTFISNKSKNELGPQYQDKASIILLARFTKNITGPYCGYFHIKERNKFRVVFAFQAKQLSNTSIEIEYEGCMGQQFTIGKLYNITAKISSKWGIYDNVLTTPSTINISD